MTNYQLVEENMDLVYFIIHKYYPTFATDEDIIQAGMIGLCHAVNTYDENKSKFSTYASNCIRNEINMEFRSRKKHRNQLSLDFDVTGEDGERGTFGDYCVGEEDIEYVDFDGFYECLNQSEKEMFEWCRSGLTVTEIAENLGCSKEVVYQQLRRIKRMWRETNGD